MIKKFGTVTKINSNVLFDLLSAFAVILFSGLILKYHSASAQGVRDGLSLCAGVVIPTLFPFMMICSFTVNSGLCTILEKPLDGLMRFAFRLPGKCACAVIMGLIGGFPAGISTASRLYESGYISREQAFRLSLFCINPGPAFVIGTVGMGFLSNRQAGLILMLSLVLSSLFLGFITRFLPAKTGKDAQTAELLNNADNNDFGKALIKSADDAARAMLSICTWVVISCAAMQILSALPEQLSVALKPLGYVCEVTSGCREAATSGFTLPATAAIIGFSGLSVIMQIYPYAKKCTLSFPALMLSRVASAALASLFCWCLCRIFPAYIPASLSSVSRGWEPWASSAPASAGLLLMCALLILDSGAKEYQRKI